MMTRSRSRRFAAVLLAVAASATSVWGQSTFELDEGDSWTPSATAPPGSPEARLGQAREALAAKQYDRAIDLATGWLERHEDLPEAAEAYLIRGDALFGQRNYYASLFDYEYVARVYTSSDAFVRALERELAVARIFASGVKRKFLGIRFMPATEETEELLIRIQERLPGSSLAEEAGMELADFYFNTGKMDLAADAYSLYLENYPKAPGVDKARRRLIYAYLASFKGPEFDAKGLLEARAQLRSLQASQPLAAEAVGAEALLKGIDDAHARKMVTTARWYLRRGDPIGAERVLRRVVTTYPNTQPARQAVDLASKIVERLPARAAAAAPDYAALRTRGIDDATGSDQ